MNRPCNTIPSVLGLEVAAPGTNIRTARLAALVGRRIGHVACPTRPCMVCGTERSEHYRIHVQPDFDTRVLPRTIRQRFEERSLGRCLNCDLFQDFNRFDLAELQQYLTVLENKDLAVSEEAFHSYPVPERVVETYNRTYLSKRLCRWKSYIDESCLNPRRVLIFRPVWGCGIEFFRANYDADCAAMEISSIAQRYCEEHHPSCTFYPGNIHGHFWGSFLSSGPYDVIVCNHTLVHSIDIDCMLRAIYDLLSPGGLAIFMHENFVKPTNPFHNVFFTEATLINTVARYFGKIDRIDDCDDVPNRHISPFSVNGDVPDFGAWRASE